MQMMTGTKGRYRWEVCDRKDEGYKAAGLRSYFGLFMSHCHFLKSRYHLAAIESLLRRPSL